MLGTFSGRRIILKNSVLSLVIISFGFTLWGFNCVGSWILRYDFSSNINLAGNMLEK